MHRTFKVRTDSPDYELKPTRMDSPVGDIAVYVFKGTPDEHREAYVGKWLGVESGYVNIGPLTRSDRRELLKYFTKGFDGNIRFFERIEQNWKREREEILGIIETWMNEVYENKPLTGSDISDLLEVEFPDLTTEKREDVIRRLQVRPTLRVRRNGSSLLYEPLNRTA